MLDGQRRREAETRYQPGKLAIGIASLKFGTNLLHCMSPLLAQSGHPYTLCQCPLLGVKRTSRGHALISAFDPKRTLGSRQGSQIAGAPARWPIKTKVCPKIARNHRTHLLAKARGIWVSDIAAQGPLCLCDPNALIDVRHGRRFAQAALKSCGSTE